MRLRFSVGVLAAVAMSMTLSACAGGASTPAVSQTGASSFQQRGFIGHEPPHPPPATVKITAADRMAALANGWTPITSAAPFGANGAGTPLLMTDGTVMIGDNTSNWYSLTPDSTGSYVNGTWTQKASLPSGYGPLYFASAVLASGKLIINGGEYNITGPGETNLGAIYDPIANTWTSVPPPTGWAKIGDAQSVVLSNGKYMIGNCCTSLQALLNEKTMAWTQVDTGKADQNSEEGWTLLPNGDVLTADVLDAPNSELYNPSSASWSTAGSLPANLTLATEMGPQTLRPDGSVFVAGANGLTAIYSAAGAWSAGPTLPAVVGQQLHVTDGPSTLLTNGNVMLAASPGVYQAPSYVYIFNGTKFIHVAGPPNAPNDSSYNLRFLLLPTGQVLETDGSNDVEIYTPHAIPNQAWAPAIQSVPATLTHGQTYKVAGMHFNGFSQANAYGDDAQEATNYPLVEIVNGSTGHVFFARTHNHSSMAVASPVLVSTMFDVPAGIELGASTLIVVTNGIKSTPVAVTIQ